MKRFAKTLLAVVCAPGLSYAADMKVSDIRLEGLQRLSAGTVFSSLPISVGDDVDSFDLQKAAESLFSTGYYDDITFEDDNGVLVVQLKERPAIDGVELDGNKAIGDDDLKKGLKDSGLGEGQIFKRSILDSLTQELERQYVSQGRYGASVKAEVEDLPRNRVKIKLVIDEGEPASIKHINIVGNTLFSDKQLLEGFELKDKPWWDFFGSSDKYSKEKLEGDIERLKSYYLDRGYLEFSIKSTQVTISEDRSEMFITLNIHEGEKYKINTVKLAGEMVLPEAQLKRLVLLQEGQTFSQVLMTSTSDYMTQRLSNAGYTFAEVRGVPKMNKDDGTVDITFFLEPGERTYVRRVNFRGNTSTADDVLRRQMRQFEAAPASNAKIQQGKVRLDRTGFFSSVKVDTTKVPGTSDQVDVGYTVEEQPSGSIGGSIGYAEESKLILSANLQQNNFLGTGTKVNFNASTSRYQDYFNIGYTDPFFTPDGVSRGFNLYYSSRDLEEINVASYSTDTLGAGVNFGWPISEIERINTSFDLTNTKLTPGYAPAQQISGTPLPGQYNGYDIDANYWVYDSDSHPDCYSDDPESTGVYTCDYHELDEDSEAYFQTPVPGFIDEYGDSFNDLSVRFSWNKSTLNRGVLANRGYSQSLSFEATVPGSDLTYWKLNYQGQYFQPITKDLTLRFKTRLGYGDGYGDLDELPFYENFYAGGQGSVRGYGSNTLGPRTSAAEQYNYVAVMNDDGTQKLDENGQPQYAYVNNDGQFTSSEYYSDQENDPFGGNVLVTGTMELLFPVPFVKDKRSVQASVFFDAGNVYSSSCDNGEVNCSGFDYQELQTSVGLGLTWISGFGPLTFSYAQPLHYNQSLADRDGDYIERFQFSMGQTF